MSMQLAIPRFSIGLRSFVALVDVLAVATIASFAADGFGDLGMLLFLTALAFVAGLRSVRIPRLSISVTASDPLALFALVASGPLAAIVVSVTSVLGATLAQEQRSYVRLAFNLGCLPVSIGAAGHVYGLLGGDSTAALTDNVVPLLVAVGVYFLANSMLMACVLSLHGQGNVARVWWESCAWSVTSFAASAGLAAGMLLVAESTGLIGVLVLAPGLMSLAALHELHRRRKEA